MSDNFGVLGSSSATVIGTATAYTCPANKAAKFKLFASMQGAATSNVSILVNNIVVAITGAMTVGQWVFTNGGAGLITAPGSAPTGQSAAATVQPAPCIYYLSAGQTVQFIVSGANLQSASVQAVGVEVDLTL